MSEPVGRWGKFSDAIRFLRNATPQAQYADFYQAAARLLELSQRFYLPDAVNVLEGKLIDEQIKQLVRLPYDAVSLLSECHWNNDSHTEVMTRGWQITIAVDPHGETNRVLRICDPSIFTKGSFPICSVDWTSETGWAALPVWCGIMFNENEPGLRIALDSQAMNMKRDFEQTIPRIFEEEFKPNVTSINNLCAILNLRNSASTRVPPPEALNRKREKNGNVPLYDYHILEVDGERWDSPFSTQGEGGVRSHLRRGHIRKLSESKYTWVRAAFVHGSIPGFVDKDYSVKNGAMA